MMACTVVEEGEGEEEEGGRKGWLEGMVGLGLNLNMGGTHSHATILMSTQILPGWTFFCFWPSQAQYTCVCVY